MNLLIEADLVNPPTMMGSFRDLTFFAHKYPPHYDVLIYCPKEDVDIYYKFMKHYAGSLDFVEDFVFEKEHGIFLSSRAVGRIAPETLPSLLNRIGFSLR